MVINDDIIKKYEPQMAIFFQNRVKEIDNEIERKVGHLIREKDELTVLLNIIEVGKTKKRQLSFVEEVLPDIAYNPNKMSTIEKVIFFTKREGFLTINEIAQRIFQLEPNLNIDDLKGTLSAVLAMDAKKLPSRLVRKRNEKNKWTYMGK